MSRLRSFAAPREVPTRERPDRVLLGKEDAGQLQALLSELSPNHRTVVVLREIEELSYAEIAEILGIATGTVMSRLHRARRELRRLWLDDSVDVQSQGREA